MSCCTCASLLSGDSTLAASGSEKLLEEKQTLHPAPHRTLDCCGRTICGSCVYRNPRFERYCPYCQISSAPSALPQGLRDPPSYTSTTTTPPTDDNAPPPYIEDEKPRLKPPNLPEGVADQEKAALIAAESSSSSASASTEPILHFLDHAHDTLSSLSLRYGVPASTLRAANKIPTGADHLLGARRTVIIPTDGTTNGPQQSLSPRPVDGEGEELRKGRIRRWQVACKEPDYSVAVMYLEAVGYDVEAAAEKYFEDEEWERKNPFKEGDSKGKEKRRRRMGLGTEGSVGSSAGDGWWRRASQAAFLGRSEPSSQR